MGNMFGGGNQQQMGNMGQMPSVNQQGYGDQQGNMHDQILGQAMQSQQPQQAPGGNPHGDMMGLAGLLLASGVRFRDALPMAAQMQQQQQSSQMQQYKMQSEQQQMMKRQQAMQLVSSMHAKGATPEEINQTLVNSGLDPADINAISKALTPDIVDKQNTVSGEYTRFKNGLAQGLSPSYNGRRGSGSNQESIPSMSENNNASNGVAAQPMQGSMTKASWAPEKDIANKDLASWAANDSGSNQLDTSSDLDMGASNQTFSAEENNNAGGTNQPYKQPNPTQVINESPREQIDRLAFERKQQLANEKFEHTHKEKISDENRKYLTEESEKAKINADKLDVIKKMKQSLGDFHQGFGSEVAYNAERILNTDAAAAAEYFTANGNTLVGDMMKDQSGVQTNQDREYYAQTKPNRTTSEKGNRLLADSLESSYKRYGQYYNLEAKAINNGMDKIEFNRRWREYAENNPVMLKDDKGNWRINEAALENANMVLSPNFDKENAKSNILIDPNGGQWTLEEVKRSMSKKR